MRRVVRWAWLPALLALVAAGSLVASRQLGADRNGVTAVAAGAATGPRLATPLLSPRRVPELVAEPAARSALAADVAAYAQALPPGACVQVGLDGRELGGRAEREALIPASNQKLLVALAALDVLGPSHRFRTTVVGAAPDAAGVVAGDLALVGGGDPQLHTPEYAALYRRPPLRTPLEQLADAVVAAGVRRVEGDLVGDESRYDALRSVPSWPPRYISDRQVGPLSALSVDDAFRITGPGTIEPVEDPPAHAAAVFRGLLEARGVVVAGGARGGSAPPGAVELGSVSSAPLTDVVGHLLRESDNGTAELLVKELGRTAGGAGSSEAGLEVVERRLRDRDLPLEGVTLADGSGLDRGNRVTCDLLASLLEQAGPTSTLAAGLPVAGETGTLSRRLGDTPAGDRLRAKTGSLGEVSTLAGFVDAPDGAAVRFALLMNGPWVADEADRLERELAEVLARYPQTPAVEALEPLPPG